MRKSPNPNDAFIFTETQKQEFVLESVKNKNYPLLIELLTKENAEYYCTGMYSHKSGLMLALALEDFKAIACFIIHGKNIAHTYKEVNSAEEVTTVTVPKSAYITDLLFSRALLDGFLNFYKQLSVEEKEKIAGVISEMMFVKTSDAVKRGDLALLRVMLSFDFHTCLVVAPAMHPLKIAVLLKSWPAVALILDYYAGPSKLTMIERTIFLDVLQTILAQAQYVLAQKFVATGLSLLDIYTTLFVNTSIILQEKCDYFLSLFYSSIETDRACFLEALTAQEEFFRFADDENANSIGLSLLIQLGLDIFSKKENQFAMTFLLQKCSDDCIHLLLQHFPVTHDERLPNLYGQVAWYSTNMQRNNVALSLLATGGDFLFADDGDSALRQIISRSTPQTRRESDFNNKIGDRLQTFFLNEQETFSAAAQSDDDYVQSALNLLIEQQDRSLLLKIIFQTQQTQLILTTVFLNDRTVLALELLQDYVDSLSLDNKIKELSQLLNAFYAVSDRQEDKKTFFYYLYKMALGSLSSFYINAILAKTLESESLFQQICSRTYIATDFLLALTQQLSAHKECAEIVFLLMYCRAKLVTFEAISQFPNKLLSGGDYQNKKAIALKEMIQLIEEHANKINDEAWKTLLLRLAPDIFGESLSSDALLKHNSASLTDLSVFSSPKKHVTFTEVASVTSISKTTLLADIEAQITAQKQNEKTYCVMALEMLKSMMQMLLPEQAVEETAAKILDTWQLLDSGIQKKIPIESPVSEYFTNYELIEASADDVARQALHPQTTARWVASTLWNSARVIKFRPSATTKLKDNKEFIDSFIDKHFHQPFSSPDQLVQPHLDAQSRPA